MSIRLSCSVAIVPGDNIFMTFPKGFDNFNDLPMEGQISVNSVKTGFTANVVNTRIGFVIPAGVNVPATSDFFV